MSIPVLDTHIHLTQQWKKGAPGLDNGWLESEGESFQRNQWTEEDIFRLNKEGGETFSIEGFVFVECANAPAIDEAKWVLDMVESPDSKVVALVANIPVPDGKEAVDEFLGQLKTPDGKLPSGLKGGRVVLLGNPMPAPTACLEEAYLAGLAALHSHGLLWEWCCHPSAIPSISEVSAKFPDMTFVLDHLGHNSGGDDFETWAPAIDGLAKNENVVAKLGAIEQWEVADSAIYLDHALKAFGSTRVLAESNWFVSTAMGDAYDLTFKRIHEACVRAAFSAEQIQDVFVNNAKRVYTL